MASVPFETKNQNAFRILCNPFELDGKPIGAKFGTPGGTCLPMSESQPEDVLNTRWLEVFSTDVKVFLHLVFVPRYYPTDVSAIYIAGQLGLREESVPVSLITCFDSLGETAKTGLAKLVADYAWGRYSTRRDADLHVTTKLSSQRTADTRKRATERHSGQLGPIGIRVFDNGRILIVSALLED